MVLKVGFLLVFLLLLQSLEAKKKKQDQGITTKISTYLESVGGFFKDAWDGFLEFLPITQKKPPKKNKGVTGIKNTKKKKVEKNSWGLGSIMTSAENNFNSLYDTVSNSFSNPLEMFKMKRSKRSMDSGNEDDQSLEDIFDSILRELIIEFRAKHEIKKVKRT